MSEDIFGKADEVAVKRGFKSTEPKQIGRRRRVRGPVRNLNMGLPEGEFDRFVSIADKLNLTYSETLKALMDNFEK